MRMADDEELDQQQDIDLDEEAPMEMDDEPAEKPSGTVGFVSGLILGALIGAGIALLVAPEKGAVTRKRLKRKLRELTDDAMDQAEDWSHRTKRELRHRRRRPHPHGAF
jgi:hypothetical protein